MATCQMCPAECKDHKWGRIAAHNEGWFFSRSGEAFCPLHLPNWVPQWRAERKFWSLREPPCDRPENGRLPGPGMD